MLSQSKRTFILILLAGFLTGGALGIIVGPKFSNQVKDSAQIEPDGEITLVNYRDGGFPEEYKINCESHEGICTEALRLHNYFNDDEVICTLIGPTVTYEFTGQVNGEKIKFKGDNANNCYSAVAALGEKIRNLDPKPTNLRKDK